MIVSAVVVFGLLLTACGDDDSDGASGGAQGGGDAAGGTTTTTGPEVGDRIESAELDGQPRLALEVFATGVRAPSALASPPGDDRLFVTERIHGQIRIIEEGVVRPEPFLDIGQRLEPTGDEKTQEDGLLALAFHPDYAENGRFFVYLVNRSGIGELLEYRVSDDPDRADPDSGVVLREYGPARMHHGGSLFVGPDGALWFGIGDGGPGQQPPPARDITNPRGALHRFDVSTPGAATGAEGNPYLGDQEGVDEMWAYGTRNPWRASIDAETGLLYVADVGAAHVEEINVVPMDEAGLDYGWPILEGTRCVEQGCDPPSGSVTPALEIERAEDPAGVCAVIGGHVYRGSAIPELQGAYLYSDLCGGFLRSFRYEDGAATEQLEWFDDIGKTNSMGVDTDGEFYVLDAPTGSVLKLVPAA
jgi:glucose/arabinose dehydrogenase